MRDEINAEQLASQQTATASRQGYMIEKIWDRRNGLPLQAVDSTGLYNKFVDSSGKKSRLTASHDKNSRCFLIDLKRPEPSTHRALERAMNSRWKQAKATRGVA
jgi:hypothetical protein